MPQKRIQVRSDLYPPLPPLQKGIRVRRDLYPPLQKGIRVRSDLSSHFDAPGSDESSTASDLFDLLPLSRYMFTL